MISVLNAAQSNLQLLWNWEEPRETSNKGDEGLLWKYLT